MRKAPACTVTLLALLGLSCGDGDGPLGNNGTGDPTTGSIHVSLVMSGADMDADGCTLTVDGGSSQQVSAGATAAFSHVSAGPHVVAIAGVAANCQVDGSASRSVTVVAAQTAREVFTVACDWRTRIAFSNPPGAYEVDIFVMNPDGTGQVNLTNPDQADDVFYDNDIDPVWSPDGTKIAFDRGFLFAGHGWSQSLDIFVIDRDGERRINLTNDPGSQHYAAWSPDGTRIAFLCARQLCLMNPDGTGRVQLTNHGEGYRIERLFSQIWSPNGSQIAYSLRFNDPPDIETHHIYVVNTDGTGQVQLTDGQEQDSYPAWSPDGTRIAFQRWPGVFMETEIWVMNPDGTDQVHLTEKYAPTWSPDGSRIAFVRDRYVWVMGSDGTDQVRLAFGGSPSWSPDGSQIAFECKHGDWHVCVMNADGTDWLQLARGTNPSWSPDLY